MKPITYFLPGKSFFFYPIFVTLLAACSVGVEFSASPGQVSAAESALLQCSQTQAAMVTPGETVTLKWSGVTTGSTLSFTVSPAGTGSVSALGNLQASYQAPASIASASMVQVTATDGLVTATCSLSLQPSSSGSGSSGSGSGSSGSGSSGSGSSGSGSSGSGSSGSGSSGSGSSGSGSSGSGSSGSGSSGSGSSGSGSSGSGSSGSGSSGSGSSGSGSSGSGSSGSGSSGSGSGSSTFPTDNGTAQGCVGAVYALTPDPNYTSASNGDPSYVAPALSSITTPPVTTVVSSLNVGETSYTQGFPGDQSLTAWFGIDFRCTLTVTQAGSYKFGLNSDDGSQMYLVDSHGNETLLVDNWFTHSMNIIGAQVVSTAVSLVPGTYEIHVPYYQGPPTELGIQLLWQTPGSILMTNVPASALGRP